MESENKYQLAISPCGRLSPDTGEPIFDRRNPDTSRQRVIELGVGTLPAVSIGSLWVRRRALIELPTYDDRIKQVSLRPGDISVVSAGKRIEQNGRSEYLIPPYIHTVGNCNLNAPCMAFRVGDDPYGLLIPPMELFRFYYAEDTNLARRLLSYKFSTVLNDLVDLRKSGLTDDNTFHVQLQRGMRAANALIAALLAGSAVAQREAARIWASIVHYKQRESWTSGFIECQPPFEGDAEFHLTGIEFESWGKTRFLAYRIDRGTLEVPWDVTFQLKNDKNREGVVLEDRPPAWGPTQPRHRPANGGNIDHGEEPDINQDSCTAKAAKGRFLCERTPSRKPKGITRFRAGARYAPAPYGRKLSTGSGTSGKTDSSPASVIGEEAATESIPPYNFESFTQVLSALRSTHGYHVRLIAPEESRTNTAEGPCWCLRPVDFKVDSNWFYKSKKEGHLRHVFVVELFKDSRYFYLFEQERRPNTQESRSLLIVCSEDYSQIGLNRLKKILETTAENEGSWPSEKQMLDLVRKYINHSGKRRTDPARFASGIVKRLQGIINGPNKREPRL